MPKFLATFHLGADDKQEVRFVTSPDDEQTLEEHLAEQLGAQQFAAFDDGSGGFVLVNTDQITRVDVQALDE